MVVAMAGVNRNRARVRPLERGQRIAGRPVVEAQHHEASRARHERARVDPAFEGLRHPVHVALRAAREPGGEARPRIGGRVGGGDPAEVEAERAGLAAERL